jgi:hypothetical protein
VPYDPASSFFLKKIYLKRKKKGHCPVGPPPHGTLRAGNVILLVRHH